MTLKRVQHSKSKNNSKKGSTYNQEIDRVVVRELSQTGKMHSGRLKRVIEKTLGRRVTPKIWRNHLRKMQSENYLSREDTRERNTKVFYSLTERAIELRDLKILRMDPERSLFLQIYANLFFRAVIEGNQYAGDDLGYILNEIHVTKEELEIDYVKKNTPQIVGDMPEIILDKVPNLTSVEERRLPITVTIYYKPTRLGVKIIESTSYRENVVSRRKIEYISYSYHLPGVSIEDLSDKYYTFKPKVEDCKAAIALLLKRDLIQPTMDFRGNTRFIVADPVLRYFLTDLYQLIEIKNEFNNIKWQFERPTVSEEQSRKIWYSDGTKSEKFFNIREIQRHESKLMAIKNEEAYNNLQKKFQGLERTQSIYINELKKMYRRVFDKYPFLFELILLIYPSFFQAIES
jgi:hypothetical protein